MMPKEGKIMDKILENALVLESKRQQNNLELIASENYVSKDILALQGSILTNKYAEGYPGKRYYGGCEYIDIFESQAISYLKKIFGCCYANVQPHSGSQANMAVYRALLKHGDKVMGMDLSSGGHLTHGHKMSFSGQDYEMIFYGVDSKTEMLDYDSIEDLALREHPKMIIAGASAYSRFIDFKRFKEIADKCGAYLMVDMAHIAGLVAAGIHPSPMPYADVVTSTTHKTLRGPRGGIIMTNNEEIAKKIDKTVFPGIQGGPLMHVIAAKAECFYEAMQPDFKEYAKQVVKNADILASTLQEEGLRIISNGTDNHLMLVDVKSSCNLTGLEAEQILSTFNITVNKNTIPNDQEKPFITSGIRLGSAALTTRGMKEPEFKIIGHIIANALKDYQAEEKINKLKKEVNDLTRKFPLNY
jgi:glycine hydroxymethyltransferase